LCEAILKITSPRRVTGIDPSEGFLSYARNRVVDQKPFSGGQAPAPAYCMSLPKDRRIALRERIRERLPMSNDGAIQQGMGRACYTSLIV